MSAAAVKKAFKAVKFSSLNTGGDVMAYYRKGSSLEIFVTSYDYDGSLPESLDEKITVGIYPHDDADGIYFVFESVRAFLKSFKAGLTAFG